MNTLSKDGWFSRDVTSITVGECTSITIGGGQLSFDVREVQAMLREWAALKEIALETPEIPLGKALLRARFVELVTKG